MKSGYLSQYFVGVAAKILSAVEADYSVSNQHEFNGVGNLKKLFGNSKDKKRYNAKFLYLNDNDDDPVTDDGFLTWYDARANHLTRSEHRLYFPTTAVSTCAEAGDLLVIALQGNNTVLVIIAENGTTISNQIKWLFGLDVLSHPGFSIREELESEQDRIAFASMIILEQIGVEVRVKEETFLDGMLSRFGTNFPDTRTFSDYARSTIPDLNPFNDPDRTLMSWIEREEILFRTLEKHLIADRLLTGFNEVDDFMTFSLSVQNRRKSRVGYAFENHIEELFNLYKIQYDRNKVTENKSKPDFIFPSIDLYHNNKFDKFLLTMLGVKSTCKDRWRQVLTEADRIKNKHLITLEAAISENQTNEMAMRKLQLIVPDVLHQTYTREQQLWLINVREFIELLRSKQNEAGL
ncbi:MAG: type II restriction endonuclease [Syntrophomonadaceae bacterium]|nr:type II restriction endonuclease [Syntrophomonadaceae bacterium]